MKKHMSRVVHHNAFNLSVSRTNSANYYRFFIEVDVFIDTFVFSWHFMHPSSFIRDHFDIIDRDALYNHTLGAD